MRPLPLLASLVFVGWVALAGSRHETVAFAVHCYDVGKQALAGLPGVDSVSSLWRDGQEVNVVRYDPGRIDRVRMEDVLRRVGTYRATLSPTP